MAELRFVRQTPTLETALFRKTSKVSRATLRLVKSTDHPTTILLDSAVELMFQIYLLRGDCSCTARQMLSRSRWDAKVIEDCARLDDALAETYKTLQTTIRSIQASRARRRKKAF